MNLFRVYKHKIYVQSYITQLHLDIVNVTISAHRTGWSDDDKKALMASASLVRKYERRLRLLRY